MTDFDTSHQWCGQIAVGCGASLLQLGRWSGLLKKGEVLSVCNRYDDRIDHVSCGRFRFSPVWQKVNVREAPHARVNERLWWFNGKPQATAGLTGSHRDV